MTTKANGHGVSVSTAPGSTSGIDRVGRQDRAKRVMDLLVGALVLVLLSPVLLVIAACVGTSMGRPILFRQRRPGLHGRPFVLFKFRTMRGPRGEEEDDAARLTPLGRVLRATSLDELPELWNVLRGDMSLVGPRPLLMEYLPLYTPHQARRHEVRPGITGWAQVNGRNALSWEEKFELDVWYVENRSLRLDLRILAATIRLVVSGDGVSQPGHPTMERFDAQRR